MSNRFLIVVQYVILQTTLYFYEIDRQQHNYILNGPFVFNKIWVSFQTFLTILFGAATVGLTAYIIYKQVMYVSFEVIGTILYLTLSPTN